MKVTIDLEDFWMEEDGGNLTDQIKQYIINNVKHKVWELIKKTVESHCELQVKKDIDSSMYKQMNLEIANYMKEGKIKSSRSSDNVSIQEFIQERFLYESGWRSPSEELQKLASNFSKEMKGRYDLLFASQLVAKMNENGLLKDDVAKILLTTK